MFHKKQRRAFILLIASVVVLAGGLSGLAWAQLDSPAPKVETRVATLTATERTPTEAKIRGELEGILGMDYYFYFQISKEMEELESYRTRKESYRTETGKVRFEGTKKHLQPSTTYYYRAVVESRYGQQVFYGDVQRFTTDSATVGCEYLQGEWEQKDRANFCNTAEFPDYHFCQQLLGDSGEDAYCCCTKENLYFSFLEIDEGHQCECVCDCGEEYIHVENEEERGDSFDCSCDCTCYYE